MNQIHLYSCYFSSVKNHRCSFREEAGERVFINYQQLIASATINFARRVFKGLPRDGTVQNQEIRIPKHSLENKNIMFNPNRLAASHII